MWYAVLQLAEGGAEVFPGSLRAQGALGRGGSAAGSRLEFARRSALVARLGGTVLQERCGCHSPPPWGHRSPGSWVQVGARRPAWLMPQARRDVEPGGPGGGRTRPRTRLL